MHCNISRPISTAELLGLIPPKEKHMTKISMALATALLLASAFSNAAFAATTSGPLLAQGDAIRACRAQQVLGMHEHHDHLAVDACLQRLQVGRQVGFDRAE